VLGGAVATISFPDIGLQGSRPSWPDLTQRRKAAKTQGNPHRMRRRWSWFIEFGVRWHDTAFLDATCRVEPKHGRVRALQGSLRRAGAPGLILGFPGRRRKFLRTVAGYIFICSRSEEIVPDVLIQLK
jgi:hypothetical protein